MTVESLTYVGVLCKTDGRRELLQYFLTAIDSGDTDKQTTGDIMHGAGVSRNSVRNHIDVFLDIGLVIKHDGDGQFTHYEPNTDSKVFTILTDVDTVLRQATERDVDEGTGAYITDLYGNKTRRTLTDFFIHLAAEWGDDNDPLTKKDVHRKCGVTRKSIIKEIDTLVDYKIVRVDNQFSYPRYEPAVGSDVFQTLVALNETLASTLME